MMHNKALELSKFVRQSIRPNRFLVTTILITGAAFTYLTYSSYIAEGVLKEYNEFMDLRRQENSEALTSRLNMAEYAVSHGNRKFANAMYSQNIQYLANLRKKCPDITSGWGIYCTAYYSDRINTLKAEKENIRP